MGITGTRSTLFPLTVMEATPFSTAPGLRTWMRYSAPRHLRTTLYSRQSAGMQGSMTMASKSGWMPSRYWVAA